MTSVLVVDDDRSIQHLLRAILTSEGFSVRCASDGEEALLAIEVAEPDLMILDLQMPVMDGRALLTELKRRGHRFAVLILSAAGARSAGRELALPALEKPFDIDALTSEASRLTGATPSRASRDAGRKGL